MTLSNDNVVILRFVEATKTVIELTDTGAICTLNATASSYSLITDGYIVNFYFLLNDVPPVQNNKFTIRAEDDDANVVYEYDLELWDLLENGAITIDSIDVISSEPCYQNHNATQDYHMNWIDVNVTVTNEFGTEMIADGHINITNVAVESSRIDFRIYDWYRLWNLGQWVGESSTLIETKYLCNDDDIAFLNHGFIDANTMWFIVRFRLRHMTAGNTELTVYIENNEGNDFNDTIYFNLGECIEHELIEEITQDLIIGEGVDECLESSVSTNLIITKGVDVKIVEKIDEGIMIWVNGVLVYNSFEHVLEPAEFGAINLYDSEDNLIENDDWLYEGELYRLRAYAYNPTYVSINVSDTRRTVWFEYRNSTNTVSLRTGDKVNVFGLLSFINDFNESTGLRILEWRFIINDNVVDSTNRYWNAYMNSTINAPLMFLEEDWDNNFLRVNIYNLGSFVAYQFTGDGKRITGGDVFDIEATSIGSIAYAETIFYNLQHVHILPELYYNGTWNSVTGRFEDFDGGYFEYGISYELDGEWVNGWKVRLYPTNYRVGHQNLGHDHDWVGWAVEWYQYNHVTSTWDKIKEDIIYSNCWGYDNENAEPDYYNRTSSQLWIDLWFSNHNSSTIIAGRVNAYYYGMYEQSEIWWMGYGEFRPMFGDVTASMFFSDLIDRNNNIDDSYGVEKVKFWAKIEKLTGNTRTWRMHNYEVKNYELASGRMQGVDNPPVVETKVLDMPQTGFLSPLIKAIRSIPSLIARALSSMGLYILSGLDTVFVGLGLPPVFSIIVNVLISLYELFEIIYASFSNMVDWLIESATQIISSLFLVIPRYLLFVGMMLTVFISYYNNIILLFTGGIGNMSNFWADYSVTDIIQLYLIGVLPFTIIARIESSKEPIKQLGEDIELFVNMIKAVFSIAGDMLNALLEFIKTIIGVI